MQIEDEVARLRTELDQLKAAKKDGWDKLQVISALLIPLVLALFAWIQNTNTEAARENTASIQLKLDSLQNERQMAITSINSKVGQVNLVSNFFEALLSKDESRKKLAIKSVLIALPDDGPDLVRIVSSSEDEDGLKGYAQKSLDERCDALIKQMYSEVPAQRIQGFNDLFSGWKNSSTIIPKLMRYASANTANANGVFNTLVFIGQMDRSALTPFAEELRVFSHQFDALGNKVQDRGEKLRARLPAGV